MGTYHYRRNRSHLLRSCRSPVNQLERIGIHMNELNEVKPLRKLPHLKIILVRFPKSTAAHVVAVMTHAMAVEKAVLIGNLRNECFQVPSQSRPIDARRTHPLLHFESHRNIAQTINAMANATPTPWNASGHVIIAS